MPMALAQFSLLSYCTAFLLSLSFSQQLSQDDARVDSGLPIGKDAVPGVAIKKKESLYFDLYNFGEMQDSAVGIVT